MGELAHHPGEKKLQSLLEESNADKQGRSVLDLKTVQFKNADHLNKLNCEVIKLGST